MDSTSTAVAASIRAHAAQEADGALGWLVGRDEGDSSSPVILGAVRCIQVASRVGPLPTPDWPAEEAALRELLPSGLRVVGLYASGPVGGDGAPETGVLSAISALNAPAGSLAFAGAWRVAAVAPSGGGEVCFGRVGGDAGTWKALSAGDLDAAAKAWAESTVCVRASTTVPDSEGAPAEAHLRSPAVSAVACGTSAAGVVAVGATGGPTVQAALGMCAEPPPSLPGTLPVPQLEVRFLWDLSGPEAGSAPAVVVTPAEAGASTPRAPTDLRLEVAHFAPANAPLGEALSAAVDALCRAAPLARKALAEAPTLPSPRGVVATFAGVPGCAAGPAFHAVYALPTGDSGAEEGMRARRLALHARLGLPTDRPLLRTCSALLAPGEAATQRTSRLVNVHLRCPPSGVSGGRVAVVRGQYEYFHYMQDNFDDKGWGCAYRSLMTIVSWFRCQHYTAVSVPDHTEIQARLVRECAQPAALLNSKKWIGALDVSLFLEVALGVTCKIENISSGADLANKGRALMHHFDTQGTPVMMGGGELAYTLLGVHFDDQSGDIKFLILDPHYTGHDDLGEIVTKQWCGWHTADKFVKNAFYNLCFPQCPECV